MNPVLRFQFRRVVRLIQVLLAIILSCLLAVVPVMAQDNPTAPIVVDGRHLFEVSQTGRFSAQERAENANQLLEETIATASEPVQIEIDESGEIPVLRVNGNHLLSVTSEDAPQGKTPLEQAQFWARQLRKAISRAREERTTDYLLQALLLSGACIFWASLSSWGLTWLWRHRIKPILEREPDESEAGQTASIQIGALVFLVLLRGAIWIFCGIYISDLFAQTRRWSRNFTDALVTSLTSDLVPLGDNSYSVADILVLIALFTALILMSRAVKKVLRLRVLSLTGLNRAAQETISLIANYALLFIGTIVLLQLWGLDISSLTVFAGVLGVGIGLGIQGIAKEFVSGLVLIFERPIQVGDFVDVEGLMGTVERIGFRSTEIRTLDGISIIIPNSRFLESEVINWSHNSPVSRLKLPIGVSYGSHPSKVRSALIDAVKEHPDVLTDPPPRVFFKGFGESALTFDVLIWIEQPYKQFKIKSDLYFRIETILRHRGIEIPFPQRDLHVRSGSLPIEVPPQLAQSLAELSENLAKWLEAQSTDGKRHTGNNLDGVDREL